MYLFEQLVNKFDVNVKSLDNYFNNTYFFHIHNLLMIDKQRLIIFTQRRDFNHLIK